MTSDFFSFLSPRMPAPIARFSFLFDWGRRVYVYTRLLSSPLARSLPQPSSDTQLIALSRECSANQLTPGENIRECIICVIIGQIVCHFKLDNQGMYIFLLFSIIVHSINSFISSLASQSIYSVYIYITWNKSILYILIEYNVRIINLVVVRCENLNRTCNVSQL